MGKAEFHDAQGRASWDAFGVLTAGMVSKGFMRTREIRWVQAELVGSDKQQCEDAPMAWRKSDWLIVLCGRESRLQGEAASET